jgi:hypothetical protein
MIPTNHRALPHLSLDRSVVGTSADAGHTARVAPDRPAGRPSEGAV